MSEQPRAPVVRRKKNDQKAIEALQKELRDARIKKITGVITVELTMKDGGVSRAHCSTKYQI
ncbi:MAG: hypothetical protein DRH10_00930 [Deltaproteobacteria bacterium]|nr:MAG: hypothetical protein DRH10_00930 [Deltaproteobacteria bacterium]RLC88378.1 MAG: hypothetical protein DRJ03_02995 [Chloroflexota bacterium]